jgi:hypothetical protein
VNVNPALAELGVLIGHWRMELYGAEFLPDPDARIIGPFHVEWIESGAALVMRQGDRANPPFSSWVVGRDEAGADFIALYADDRGVSRVYRMSLVGQDWQIWREQPDFSQRFEARLEPDGAAMRGSWQKSTDGGTTWEHDFNLDYIRLPD